MLVPIVVSADLVEKLMGNPSFVEGLDSEFVRLASRSASFAKGSSGKVEFDVGSLSIEKLNMVKAAAVELDLTGTSRSLASFINLKSDPLNAKIAGLPAFAVGLKEFLKSHRIKGWIFMKDGPNHEPWLVHNVEYERATKYDEEKVSIRLVSNIPTFDKEHRSDSIKVKYDSFTIRKEHISKRTINEVLLAIGLVVESEDLHAEYSKTFDLLLDYKSRKSHQFVLKSECQSAKKDESFYSRNTLKIPAGRKVVNDEDIISRSSVPEFNSELWKEDCEVPYHCKMYVFDLTLHVNYWIHVNFLEPYVYKTDLKDKLVLPKNHHDLIEILASDMGFVMEDIVDGKTGGTVILCKGGPGLGKTLTAEVYSEVIQKPLYKVHAGQLGVTANDVEKSLQDTLSRASRWGAVYLLDESDVYTRKRENDISHNAVVASFLRTLEYFDGLLFMTTNRSDDIDDAIVSRCIAIINYSTPEPDDMKKIWKVISTSFKNELDDKLIDQLVEMYPNISGRDIKELLKITLKYCKGKGVKIDADAVRICAMFRGL